MGLRILTAAVAVLAAATIGACGGGAGDGAGAPELEAGRGIYVARCATCHGVDGDGGLAPKTGDGLVVDHFPDIADHVAVVRDGVGAMPAWGGFLSDAEIEAVVRYQRDGL
jgi:mono/diheme cytochrome c family protein